MSLETKIMEALKTAMKAKDDAALRSLRSIKAAILLAKTSEGSNGEITEADELKLLQKLVKQRKDSITIFEQQNRADLAKTEAEEVAVIEQFLPEQMSDEALTEKVKAIITELGATSPADMGKVMGAANKALAGQAEGKAIADKVKALLGNG
jgi:uncharacterized protein